MVLGRWSAVAGRPQPACNSPAAHKELLEEHQRSQEVDERLAASERATEREREAARRLGRDKGELLLQLQEAAERCKERTS